jgi:hypothetical protein
MGRGDAVITLMLEIIALWVTSVAVGIAGTLNWQQLRKATGE